MDRNPFVMFATWNSMAGYAATSASVMTKQLPSKIVWPSGRPQSPTSLLRLQLAVQMSRSSERIAGARITTVVPESKIVKLLAAMAVAEIVLPIVAKPVRFTV
eukprot:Amastigsp_a340810_67.p7 type:complete len:103 gc:universal Amastigsp_a340810_67:1197-889(-)